MANEINIQAALTFQRFIPLLQGSGNLNINQTGTHGIFNVQNVGTTAEQLTGVDVATLGYLFVKNLDATNFVQLATDNAFSATSTFAKLRPGEFCLVPSNATTMPWAKANTAGCDVLVCAVEA